MSWNPALDPRCTEAADALETLIVPRARDLGGFAVRRALPASSRQMVGPFIFFDQVGPAEFVTGQGIDIRPHPHIGLATVTYLFRGEFQHRDSLGSDRIIRPGAVNWMIAGRGITHSERTSEATRRAPHSLFGIQTWVALPDEAEDTEPAFEHVGRDALPMFTEHGRRVRLILGSAWGERAPVRTFNEMFYIDAELDEGMTLPLPDEHEDRAIYVVAGSITVAGREFEAGQMMVFRPGDALSVRAGAQGARLVLLGGETLNGPRYIWWNFVASSRERIEAAREDWQRGHAPGQRFALPPGDADEFIELPDTPPGGPPASPETPVAP